ncbi:MAG: outer membrane beta-barrel protein [Bacteroidia bacterium]
MRRLFQIFILISFSVNSIIGQNHIVGGKVVDENDSSLVGAVVGVYQSTDSSLVEGKSTNFKGSFRFELSQTGNYFIKVSYIGYKDYYKSFELGSNQRLGKIKLNPKDNTLKEVEVKTSAIMATQNGDTTSFNSNAFKVNKDASAEDLLSKMPGVTKVNGKVQAQGEDVKQVLVDGKPFFGDDPNTVLKNLPAEIIDKIQVFDKKSDQAVFTGFDDGNTSKTINIITKTEFRNGLFGRANGGYGHEDKYKGGISLNKFNNNKRLTILGMSNNINEQNFSSEDLVGVMSSGGSNSRGRRGGGRRRDGGSRGGNPDDFLVNASNGITQTHAFGLNYSDDFGKSNITFAYFFNMADNNAISNLNRNYFQENAAGLTYTESNTAFSRNINNRLNIRYELKIDSFHSVILQPKISLQYNDGYSKAIGENKDTAVINDLSNNFNSKLNGSSFAMPILFRKSFLKRGRTISVNLNPTYGENLGNSSYQSYNANYYPTLIKDTIDQQSDFAKYDFKGNGSIEYTEPITEKGSVSIDYNLTYNGSNSVKNTFNKDFFSDNYSLRDSLVSNSFNSVYEAHRGRVSYKYRHNKIYASFGLSAQQAILRKDAVYPLEQYAEKAFSSLLPNFFMRYTISKSTNFRLFYRASNNPPSIDQLQNVLNNSNALQLSMGNPDLKQDFQHFMGMRYSSVNTLKSTSFFSMFNFNYNNNYIGNQTIIAGSDTVVFNSISLARGAQITRPINFDSYYTARVFVNYSFPFNLLKSNINLNAGYNYNYLPSVINDKLNFTKTSNPSFLISISSNISENIDFLLSSNTAYNDVKNDIQPNLNSAFYVQTSSGKINFTFFKRLVLTSEYANSLYNGLNAGFNQNIHLLNGALAIKLFKENRGELRLFVFDILNQNQSIQRNITETYYEDVQTNILQRYFMLSFAYNFKSYKKNDEKED